jgi:RNA polymerase sigma-70 factor (ECF subfamily)
VALVLDELSQCVSQEGDPEEFAEGKQLERDISAFLKTEPVLRRNIFLRRYFYLEDLPQIAQRYDLKEANVRMMLSRTRQKLRKYLQQEGYIV